MSTKTMLKNVIGWLLLLLSWQLQAQVLDTIVAVVEDDVILERELQDEVLAVVQRIQASKSEIPPNYVLRKQVLEKMIVDKLQRQLAEKAGINVSEEMLNSSVADIAQRNNMNVEQFREELARQGMDYTAFFK